MFNVSNESFSLIDSSLNVGDLSGSFLELTYGFQGSSGEEVRAGASGNQGKGQKNEPGSNLTCLKQIDIPKLARDLNRAHSSGWKLERSRVNTETFASRIYRSESSCTRESLIEGNLVKRVVALSSIIDRLAECIENSGAS